MTWAEFTAVGLEISRLDVALLGLVLALAGAAFGHWITEMSANRARNLARVMYHRHTLALEVAFRYGQTDGAHHKMYVIDQMVRHLAGSEYETMVRNYEQGGEFHWDVGS